MRVVTITASEVTGIRRFDSKFHIARQNQVLAKVYSGKWPTRSVGETFGRKNIWSGDIFARVYAPDLAYGKPLLVPYDLFRYLPWSDKILSRTQVAQFGKLEIQRGWLFIVCSGRNLGPITIADQFCTQFTMSHDMVRVSASLSEDLFYVAAFLSTAHGQAAIRTDMNGSVIDHTDANQIAALRYPVVDAELKTKCATLFREAFEKRERARLLLVETQAAFMQYFGLVDVEANLTEQERARRFTVLRGTLGDRIDAEPRAPRYEALRKRISASPCSPLDKVANVAKPASRYRTNYVEDGQYGIPMMNGRQIAQYRAIALRHMSLSGFKDPSAFILKSGTTLLTADGRAEENLGDCALVAGDRAGWAASGHVYRVLPRDGVNAGLVYLACACPPVQAQLKALATGSVVDALNVQDVANVLVPYEFSEETGRLGNAAQQAWQLFAEASSAEDGAIAALELELNS